MSKDTFFSIVFCVAIPVIAVSGLAYIGRCTSNEFAMKSTEGYNACLEGKMPEDCPYRASENGWTNYRRSWLDGWLECRMQRQPQTKPGD